MALWLGNHFQRLALAGAASGVNGGDFTGGQGAIVNRKFINLALKVVTNNVVPVLGSTNSQRLSGRNRCYRSFYSNLGSRVGAIDVESVAVAGSADIGNHDSDVRPLIECYPV